MTEHEMVGRHHQINGHEFEQIMGDMKDGEAWCALVHGVIKIEHDSATEQQQQRVCKEG